MARRIREHDWGATPLGPIKTWTSRLRTTVIVTLESPVATLLLWGPALTQLYNDHWREMLGGRHPAALGQPTLECFPETVEVTAPLYERVRRGEPVILKDTLLPISRCGEAEDAWWNVHYLPVPDEGGVVAGILCTVIETSETVLAGRKRAAALAKLRENEERQAFLVRLGDRLRPMADAREIQAAAAELLGRHLGVNRANYYEVGSDADTLRTAAAYVDGVGEMPTPTRISDFGPAAVQAYRRGGMLVIADVLEDERFEPSKRGLFAEVEVRAGVGIPLIKDGRLVAIMTIHDDQPRRWTEAEIGLLEETAERTWAAVERARAEAALRDSEARFRSTVEIETVGVTFWTPGGEYALTEANDAFLRMIGRSREEAIGLTSLELTLPRFHAAARDRLSELERTGVLPPYEKQFVRKDGAPIWALCAGRMIGGELFEFILDIDDRRRAEAALRRSEARFRALVTTTSYAVYRMGPDWSEVHELDGGGFMADTTEPSAGWMERSIHPDDRPRVSAVIKGAIRDRRGFELEHRVRRADGTPGWTLSRAVPILDETGAIAEWFGAASDVTDRKLAEQALADSERRLRTLIENVPQLVWRSSDAGHWTWASPQWRAYTGQSDADSRGTGWLDTLHADDRAAARAAWRDAAARGLLQLDHRIRRAADGQYRWFQARGVPVRDAAGRVTEWLGTCTDIDEQVRAREVLARSGEELERQVATRTEALMAAEARLRQSEKLTAIGQLTGGIAHDFNNMLQALGSSLDVLRMRIGRGEVSGLSTYLDRAERTTDRAAALTHRLLAFSRQQELEPRAISIDHVVRGMEELIRRTVGPSIQLELQLQDGEWLVWCDPSQLENALLNLCINARDAMPDGGWLTIGTEEVELPAERSTPRPGTGSGRSVSLSVRDAGTGIASAVRDRVFEPFFTTKPIGVGTGLGLSQVYGFVRQSGGFVELDTSTEPGSRRGTTVRMRFPFHGEDPEHEGRPTTQGGPTVLLAEDEADIRASTADCLRDRGYRVLEAENGAAAARLIETGVSIDFLVTDQGMPGGMTGAQLIALVRERHPRLPTLLVTGYAEVPSEPAAPILRKPFKVAQLLRLIEQNLGTDGGDLPD